MNFQWELLRRVPRGHKWFRDTISRRVAVCDDSGSNPSSAEDGVLWLDTTKPITLGEAEGVKYVHTPVVSERTGEPSVVSSNVTELAYLMVEHQMALEVVSKDDTIILGVTAVAD